MQMSFPLSAVSRGRRMREGARTLVMALLAMVLAWLAFLHSWPETLTIGSNDARFISGFYEVEKFADMQARWTTAHATLALPRPPDGSAALLTLRLHDGRQATSPDPNVQLLADGQPAGTFQVLRHISGTRLYTVLLPPDLRLDWALRLDILSDTASPPGDRRELGVVVNRASLQPVHGANLPSL